MLDPVVEMENWGYKGSTTSLVILSRLICHRLEKINFNYLTQPIGRWMGPLN
jgi:hypothetical protein